jgi:AraC-like DNA-binding protein
MATIGPGVARALIELAVRQGMKQSPLLEVVGVDAAALASSETRLSFDRFAELWATVARGLQLSELPLLLARGLRLEAYDVMGFAVLTASTMREAVERVVRYNRLFTDAGALELDTSDELAWLYWNREGPLGLGFRLVDESVVASSMSHLRHILGQAVNARAVSFRHAAPPQVAPFRAFFGVAPGFNAARVGVAFDPAVLEQRPSTANPAMAEFFARFADERLRAVAASSLSAQVREAVARQLADGEPSLEGIAGRLAVGARTLRRKLTEEGTSFRELVEAVRKERARALLEGAGLSVSETAFLVGFSDASTFCRAYRRWYGHSPGEREQG